MPIGDQWGVLQGAVPDYAAQEAQRQMQALQIAQSKQQIAQHQHEMQEQEGFQTDLTHVLASPTAQGYSSLIAKHPKFAQQVKSSWDVLDDARKNSDLQAMTDVYSAAANGKHDLAAGLMERRIEADKKAGQDTTHDQAVLDALKSDDPVQQKAALGMIGVTLAAVTGPDKFEQTLGQLTKGQEGYTLTPGAKRFDSSNNLVSEAPAAPQYREIQTTDANGNPVTQIVAVGGGATKQGGGDPASPGAVATTAPGGFDHAVEHVLSNEGGYNPSDMNGAPVNFGINQKANPGVDVKNLTREQAKQIYHDKYWVPSGAENLPANLQAPYFDVYIRNPAFAKRALAQSGGDPAKFMEASSAYFQKLAQKPSGQPYARAWADRDAKNAAIATGGAAAVGGEGGQVVFAATGAPKPKPHRMSPQEVAAEGLDPKVVYYRDANGVPQAVGGQSTKDNPLKPWPGTALTARAQNQASITNIDNAIRLLDPKNNSPEAQVARSSIGIGTGALGDQFTQWNDPKGTPFRALLGEIGGVIIKDISGAAVSPSEDARLKKWIPRDTDRPEVARAKLLNLRRELQQKNYAFDTTYGPDQGYRPFGGQSGDAVRVRSVQEAQKLPSGTLFVTPDGRTLRKK